MNKRWTHLAAAAAFAFISTVAQAGGPALPGDLTISGTVSLDLVNSLDATGFATQSGSLSHLAGAALTGASFSGLSFSTGGSPLTGQFTQVTDGIGAVFNMDGSADGDTTEGLYADLTLNLSNTSATNTYFVTFAVAATNQVFAEGADAYAYSEIEVRDAANQIVFFNDEQIDTAFPTNNFSGASADSTFSVSLAPGQSTSFSALQQQQGGQFSPGSYSASLTSFISLQSVVLTAVPEPATWGLMGLGLLALSALQRRRGAA